MNKIKELTTFVDREDTNYYYESRLFLIVEKINELARHINEKELEEFLNKRK